MIKKLFIALLFTVGINAQGSVFRTEGLDQPIRVYWDGHHSELKHSIRFCLKLDDYSQAADQYSLKLLDLNSGSDRFIARSYDRSIALKFSLSDSSATETILPGRNSKTLTKDAFCKGSGRSLQLQLTAFQLEKAKGGEYRTNIQLIVSNSQASQIADQLLQVVLVIPELISIHGDRQINLQGFQNLVSEANLCVYRNGAGSYKLKAEGLKQAQGRFELFVKGSASTPALPYQVNIKSGHSAYQTVTPGVLIHNLTGSPTINCREGNNLKVQVVIADAVAKQALAGTYQGQFKITVAIQ